MIFFHFFSDPNSGRDQDKEEREIIVHPPKQIKNQEEKQEKIPVKRQRRQKTNNDSIIREDDRRVCTNIERIKVVFLHLLLLSSTENYLP